MLNFPLDDNLLQSFALQQGYVTQEQLEQCLTLQRTLSPPRPLWTILMDKGYLSAAQIDQWVAQALSQMEHITYCKQITSNELLEKILLDRNYITSRQLEECLALQKMGNPHPLALILIEKDYLAPSALLHLTALVPDYWRTLEQAGTTTTSSGSEKATPHNQQQLSEEQLKELVQKHLFISQEQLEQCLHERQEMNRRGIPIDLAGILLYKGYLTPTQLERLGIAIHQGQTPFSQTSSGIQQTAKHTDD